MTTSRQLVRCFMTGCRCERLPVLPLAFYHAARFDGAPFEELVHDATRLSRALLQQRQLLGGDCVSVRLDDVWFAEAAGLPVSWEGGLPQVDWSAGPIDLPSIAEAATTGVFGILLDVVDRLSKQLRREAPVLVSVPGPLLLASRATTGDPTAIEQATRIVRDLAERSCHAGAELILLCESADSAPGKVADVNAPILNTVRYYKATPIVWGPPIPHPLLPAPALFPADAASSLVSGGASGLLVPEQCFTAGDRLTRFAAEVTVLRQPVFLVVPDEAIVQGTVESSTKVMGQLQRLHYAD